MSTSPLSSESFPNDRPLNVWIAQRCAAWEQRHRSAPAATSSPQSPPVHPHYVPSACSNAYLSDVFAHIQADTENIALWSHKKRETRTLSFIQDPIKRNRLLQKFWASDFYFTPNTYKPFNTAAALSKSSKPSKRFISGREGKQTEANLYRILAWGIDVDFRHIDESGLDADSASLSCSGTQLSSPTVFYDYLMQEMDGLLPVPNWIEYGHQLRLIYLLAEPINCSNGHSLQKALKKATCFFCNLLNEALDCHAEPQKAWYRLPGSINSKDGSVVAVQHISDVRFSVQELLNEYLPTLPLSKAEYSKKRKSSKRRDKSSASAASEDLVVSHDGRVARIHSNRTLQLNRMSDYRILRTFLGIPREKLLFLYAVSWLQIHDNDQEQLMEELLRFNQGFPAPLPQKEVQSKFRTLPALMKEKRYRYRNSTIMQELGLSEDDCQSLGLTLHTDAKTLKRQQQIEAGNTSKQKQQRRYEQVWQLYVREKLGAADIAVLLGYSRATIKNDITRIRKELKTQAAEMNTAEDTAYVSKPIAGAESSACTTQDSPSSPPDTAADSVASEITSRTPKIAASEDSVLQQAV